jgi:hypothetical protein
MWNNYGRNVTYGFINILWGILMWFARLLFAVSIKLAMEHATRFACIKFRW